MLGLHTSNHSTKSCVTEIALDQYVLLLCNTEQIISRQFKTEKNTIHTETSHAFSPL